MVKKHKPKVTKTFLNALAIFSILGFGLIFLKSVLNLDWGVYTPMAMMVILGVALVVEGQIKSWGQMFKNGLTSDEFAHVFTGIIGLIAIVIGGLGFFEIIRMSPVFNSMLGILAVFGIAIISIETWLVA